jgi:hypothetical protein
MLFPKGKGICRLCVSFFTHLARASRLQSRLSVNGSKNMTRMTPIILPDGQPRDRYARFGFLLPGLLGGDDQPLRYLLQLFRCRHFRGVIGGEHVRKCDEGDTSDGDRFQHTVEDQSLVA